MQDAEFVPESKLRKELGLSEKPIILVIQHPVSSEVSQAGEQMCQTLQAVSQFKDYQPVVIYPNGEQGSTEMIRVYQEWQMETPNKPPRYFPNLPYLTFVSLLKYSSVIVGNSSCGLVEAPLFGVPSVDIGSRQHGRIGGVNYWAPYDSKEIQRAIRLALEHGGRCPWNPYAISVDGPKIIADVLESE